MRGGDFLLFVHPNHYVRLLQHTWSTQRVRNRMVVWNFLHSHVHLLPLKSEFVPAWACIVCSSCNLLTAMQCTLFLHALLSFLRSVAGRHFGQHAAQAAVWVVHPAPAAAAAQQRWRTPTWKAMRYGQLVVEVVGAWVLPALAALGRTTD